MTSMATATDPEPATDRRRQIGRWGAFFAIAWLAFLIPQVTDAARLGTLRGDLAVGVYVAFAGVYVLAAFGMRGTIRLPTEVERAAAKRRVRSALLVLTALSGGTLLLIGVDGLATFPYLAVVGAFALGRYAIVWVLGCAAAAEALGVAYGQLWDDASGTALGTLSTGLGVWAFVLVMQRQAERVRATRAEGELALETERGRFARDLHDIVGHSLSVITVKAALAQRLLDADPASARRELDDVERLARDALDDVRSAVVGYRAISLPAELATARAVLEASGIEADLPMTAEGIPTRLRELFAWTVREGVTNVVRHSGARRCTVRLTPDSITVEDDGRGNQRGPAGGTTAWDRTAGDRAAGGRAGGSGLIGLRERAAAAGAAVLTEQPDGGGFRLTVTARPAL